MSNQELKSTFKGCYVATLTPFDSGGRLDTGAIEAHCSWLIEQGIEGLCPAGTTGEFLYLSKEEKKLVVEHTVKAAAGRVPVIAGVWANSLNEVWELAGAAEVGGAQGVFLPPPIYYPASDDAICCWYQGVSEATCLPVFAYNIPQYAANAISVPCLTRLFADDVIAGVKDSTGNAERMKELVSRYGSDNVVFAASDGFASEGRRLGADGFISAIGNAAPALFAKLWAGDDSLQDRVNALRTSLKQMGSIPALKYLLTKQGFPFGESRIPCSELTSEQKKILDGLVEGLGV